MKYKLIRAIDRDQRDWDRYLCKKKYYTNQYIYVVKDNQRNFFFPIPSLPYC